MTRLLRTPLLCLMVLASNPACGDDSTLLSVNPVAENQENLVFATLGAAAEAAIERLNRGKPVTIRLEPGVYRETLQGLIFDRAEAETAPLIIEAAPGAEGEVILSGSDVVHPEAWRDEGDGLFSVPWPHAFGNSVFPWGSKGVLGHRSEMLFVDGQLQHQVLLETYVFARTGRMNDHGQRQFDWTLRDKLDPGEALFPGSFGVVELGDHPRLYFRPLDAEALRSSTVELALRPTLADFGSKRHLTLRGLTVQHYRTPQAVGLPQSPLEFARGASDIVVDDCVFQWNNNVGLRVVGDRWTVRDSRFNFNGYSGINGSFITESLFESNVTSFNNWRGNWGGQRSFFIAGVKLHQSRGVTIRDHLAVGNLALGVWFDINCLDITVERVTAVANEVGLHLELSNGPFRVNGSLLAFSRREGLKLSNASNFDVANVLVYQNLPLPESGNAFDVSPAMYVMWRNRTDSHAVLSKTWPADQVLRDSWLVAGPEHAGALVAEGLWVDKDHAFRTDHRTTLRNVTYDPVSPDRYAWFAPERTGRQWLSSSEWEAMTHSQGCTLADVPLIAPDQLDFRRSDDAALGYPFVALDPSWLDEAEQFEAWGDRAAEGVVSGDL